MNIKSIAISAAACVALLGAMPAGAQTLDRIKETAFIKMGYLDNARPFSYANSAGKAEGYTVELCQHIVNELKKELSLPNLQSEFVPVALDFRSFAIDNARIDLLCAPTSVTLAKRKEASYSIPVFGGGIRAVMMTGRADQLRAAIEADKKAGKSGPVWRGSPASRLLKGMTFAVVAGTTSQKWVQGRVLFHGIEAKAEPVADYQTGLRLLQEGKVDAFFGDRAIIHSAIDPAARKNYTILDREFTHEPYSLGLAKGDDDFRLAVDRALSHLYASPEFAKLYAKYFGDYDDKADKFFHWFGIPD
jgi:polar amino acid transport system substrate-binding protein